MSISEIIIINDEYYYKILNGTSYVYKTIPKEFKPYFDKLQQQNKKYKEVIENINLIIKEIAYGGNEDYYMEKFKKINEQLKEVE